MTQDFKSPLDDNHYRELKRGLEAIREAEVIARKAKAAEFPGMDQRLEELNEQRRKINLTLQQFFPNRQ